MISIVVPMFNEAENIHKFFSRLKAVLEKVGCLWEVICINDGSEDATLSCLISFHQQDSRVKVIEFSKNFGKEYAISAGIHHASGDAIIVIDSDLQHPPETIIDFIGRWRNGSEIVFGVRHSRENEKVLKRISSKMFYFIFGKLTKNRSYQNISDFCLLDKKVVNIIKEFPEQNRFMKGIIAWVGFKQDFVEYRLQKRNAGQSKWNYWRLWNFAIEGITSFSTITLRIWTYIGFTLSFISFLYAGKIVLEKIIFGIAVPGYASLIVAITLLGGVQMLSLGIIGEYIGRIYIEVKNRPLFIIRKLYGFDQE